MVARTLPLPSQIARFSAVARAVGCYQYPASAFTWRPPYSVQPPARQVVLCALYSTLLLTEKQRRPNAAAAVAASRACNLIAQFKQGPLSCRFLSGRFILSWHYCYYNSQACPAGFLSDDSRSRLLRHQGSSFVFNYVLCVREAVKASLWPGIRFSCGFSFSFFVFRLFFRLSCIARSELFSDDEGVFSLSKRRRCNCSLAPGVRGRPAKRDGEDALGRLEADCSGHLAARDPNNRTENCNHSLPALRCSWCWSLSLSPLKDDRALFFSSSKYLIETTMMHAVNAIVLLRIFSYHFLNTLALLAFQ